MAHKALVGGTAYEISGGKTMIGGTAYSIKNGKTLVDGTAYEVGFAKEFVPVYDLGELSTTKNFMFEYYSATTYPSELPDGLENCTHISVNGVVFECTDVTFDDYDENTKRYSFYVGTFMWPVAEGQYIVRYLHNTSTGEVTEHFQSYSGGTYSVKIGYLG